MSNKKVSGLRIESVKYASTSASGNPTYLVTFTDGMVAKTQTDAAIGYGIDNPEYRNTDVTVTFTRNGRIVHVEVGDTIN